MKKHIFLLSLLFWVLLVSGCVESGEEAQILDVPEVSSIAFSGKGVYFEYPESWIYNTENLTPNNLVIVFDPDSQDEEGNIETLVAIQSTPLPMGQTLKETFNATYKSAEEDPNFVSLSRRLLSIDGIEAYENISEVEENGVLKKKRDVWLEKRGMIYVIRCVALKSDFDQQQINFDLIISTFQIK